MTREPEDNRTSEAKHRDPIRDACFEEREELRARCDALETLLEASGERREEAEARAAELEKALRRIANSYKDPALRTGAALGKPRASDLVRIAQTALSSSTSEAKEDTSE